MLIICVKILESKILSEFKLNNWHAVVKCQINKTKMVWSLKIKCLIISKLNFNEGKIYKKISNFDYFKNWKFFQIYKGWNRKGWESALKNWIKLSRKYLGPGWVDGWMGGSQSRVKDCLQQSKIL